MSKAEISLSDPFLLLIRNLQSEGLLTQVQQTQLGSKKYLIDLSNQEAKDIVESLNLQGFEEYAFSFSLNNRVTMTQNTNYNAVDSFNSLQEAAEKTLKSVYQISTAELQDLQEDFENQLYNVLTDNLQSLLEPKDFALSLIEGNENRSLLYEAKEYFPFRVDFRFPNTDNSFYKLLVQNEAYELMIELIHANDLAFQPDLVSSNTGDVELFSFSIENFLSLSSEIPLLNNWKTVSYPEINLSWLPKFDQIDGSMLKKSVLEYIDNNAPSYSSIAFGDKKSNFEIICYKIEKFSGSMQSPNQVFYVAASDENREFIDTQVYFSKEYYYKVHAIGVALTTSYEYLVELRPIINKAGVTVREKPMARLFKFELFDTKVTIQGICPTKPEVSFFNRSNEESRMRFYFEPSMMEERETFIPIQESDGEFHINSKKDGEEKTVFKLGKDNLTYQIFKLNKKPKSYDDFADALMAEINSSDRSSSEVYDLYLTPNRKFYFLFRAKNGFNLFSNPTPIYEVELLQDADESKVIVNTVDFLEDTTMRAKTFGRFLRIYPSFDQLSIRDYTEVFEGTELYDEVSSIQEPFTYNNKKYFVGDTNYPIWGKKFKFRIRSRNTGKLIDINVDFVLEKKQTEADF